MASYLDSVPNFNPYIQQLPIEAMVAVGMEKQQLYDKGVERIQSQIDQVGGLNIVRPQDRQYLQSKLDELGSKLKTVAAADFSNNQLVNSIGGMTSSIARDQNVISSVQSTAQRKALQERKQKDIEAGKYNPANEYLLNLTDQEWFNNPNVGVGYSGYYRTPIDVWGKIKEIAKEVGVDEKTIQNLFETDASGKTKFDQDGNPIWNNIMVEETLKGKDASKILNAFQNALTPADYEQLSTEGRYKYRNVDPESLSKIAMSSTDKNIKFNTGKIELLKIDLAKLQSKAKPTEDDQKLISSMNDEIKYFENLNIEFGKSKQKILESVISNPESAKSALYTDNYLSNMSETLSSKEISRKFSVNPMFDVTMKLNEFKQKQEQFNATYALSLAADRRAQEKHDAEQLLLANKAAYFQGGGVDEPLDADPNVVRSMVEDGYSASVSQYNNINNKLALEAIRMANPNDTEEELQKKLFEIAAYNGKTINPDSGEVNDVIQTLASSLLTTYRINKDSVPVTLHGLIDESNKTLKKIESQKSIITKAQEDAKQAAALSGVDIEAYDKAIASIKPTTVKLLNGESVNLSRQDIIDFVNLRPQMYNTFGELSVDKNQEMLRNQSQIRLSSKFGNKLNELINAMYPMQPDMRGESLRPQPSEFIRGVAESLNNAEQQKFNKFLSEAYQKNGAVPMGKTVTIDMGDEKPVDYRNKFLPIVQKMGSVMGSSELESLNASIVSGNFGATITTMPGSNPSSPSTYTLNISDKSGVIKSIEVEASDYKSLTGYNPPTTTNVKNAFDLLGARGTTNLQAPNQPETAYFKSGDFLNFKSDKYSVMGDLEEDVANPEIVYPRIYIFDKSNNSFQKSFLIGDVALPKRLPDGQVNPQLESFSNGVTPQFIKQTTNFPIY